MKELLDFRRKFYTWTSNSRDIRQLRYWRTNYLDLWKRHFISQNSKMFPLERNSFREVSIINCRFGPTPVYLHVNMAFSKRISEDYPSWLAKGVQKSIYSSVQEHMFNSCHIPPLKSWFKIIHKVRVQSLIHPRY